MDSTIVEIEFDYSKTWTEDEQKALQSMCDRKIEFKTEANGVRLDWGNRTFILPLEDALKFGEVTVKRIVTGGILSTLREVICHLQNLKPVPPFNEKVNVSVPGLGLLMINEVVVRLDYCTEMLQKDLDEGWKILTICPQPNQRRPDYVLGRTKHDN